MKNPLLLLNWLGGPPQPAGGPAPRRHRNRPLPRLLLGLLFLAALAGGLLHPLGARAQYAVTTLAGGGANGATRGSADGTGTIVGFNGPTGVAADASGTSTSPTRETTGFAKSRRPAS